MQRNNVLIIAGCLSFVAAVLHICCIFGGPDWYRFFGAGERMAQLSAAGDWYPTVITLVIAAVLSIWGLYAFSGAGLIIKLPLLRTCLVLITAVYLIRGVLGLIAPFVTSDPVVHQNSITFWIVSSVVCCIYGFCYLLGTKELWRSM